ncbi:MAG: hypothetical protein ACE5K3_06525 [bacterium]
MAKPSILFLLIFWILAWGQIEEVKGVIIKPNRSLIFGKVEKIKKDFPYVTLTVKVIRSYTVEKYVNFIKADETVEIQPNYTGKEFKPSSFFEKEENLNNLQAYYFLPGDYFFAEVSLLGDERERKALYLNIQRVNEESVLKMVEPPNEFLKGYRLPLPSKLPPKPSREYGKLASVLYELVNSPHRHDFAERRGLYLSQDRVRVIIELLPEFEDLEGDYEMVVEGRTKSLIKALVSVDQLGLLAKDPSVGFIRPPHKPHPTLPSIPEPARLNRSRMKKAGE